MTLKYFCAAVAIAATGIANAPAWAGTVGDCRSAFGYTQQLACTDATVRELDDRLAEVNQMGAPEARWHNIWATETNRQCGRRQCVVEAYRARIEYLLGKSQHRNAVLASK